MKKRVLGLILTLVLIVGVLPVGINAAGASYNVDSAIAYAKKNWNNGKGQCAEFVSRCVKAGGLNISIETGTGPCYRAIMKASGLERVTLKLNSNGYATKKLNGDNLAAGDVVIQWCSTHNISPHILICGGYDSQGYATFYAHNGPLNNQRYNLGLNEHNGHTTKCDMGGQVIRLSTLNTGSTAPESPKVTVVPTTESSYLAKAYVKETDACVVTKITKPAGSNITVSGLYLYDENGNCIKKASFDITGLVGKNTTSFHSWYEINREIGVTLTPGTVYKYKFFVVVDNTTYEGETYSFTTKGTAPVTKYTITYDANGGSSAPAKQEKIKGTPLTLTKVIPIRSGYEFLGWSTNSSAATVEYASGATYTKDGNVTLYAVWQKIAATYTITYHANGGSSAPANQTKTEGVAINLSTSVPVRENYKFIGWSTKSNATSAEYLPGGSFKADQNTTLYAVWEAIKAEPDASEVHFPRVNVYFQDQFTDVPANQWYTRYIAEVFELGIMNGNSKTTFNPYGDITIAESITMASRIHSIYTTGSENFKSTGIWYQVYLDYAYDNGIISQAYYYCDVSQKATRAQFAEIFAGALPDEALAVINNVKDDAIPDVKISDRSASSIYKLYRSGILAGSDANGTFNPETYITRAEAATVASRMAESDNRVRFSLNY